MSKKIKRSLLGALLSLLIVAVFLLSYYSVNGLLNWLNLALPIWVVLSLSFVLWFALAGLSSFLFLNEQNQFTTSKRILKEMAKGNFNFIGSKDAKRLRSIDKDWDDFFAQMEATNRSLAKMEEMKQAFISNVSHEIRSPLTSIVGFSQLAMTENDIEKRQHYLRTIQSEAIRLSELSDSLLRLTALEEDEKTLEKQPFDLAEQLQLVIQGTASQFQEKKIEVRTDLATANYCGNQELMYQIWQNIMINSLKFTPENGQVAVAIHLTEGFFTVTISDSGIGIAEADQERIFERFYKADESRSAKTGGSGLGLSIVAKIIELHADLSIEVEKVDPEGTCFSIKGPLVTESKKHW